MIMVADYGDDMTQKDYWETTNDMTNMKEREKDKITEKTFLYFFSSGTGCCISRAEALNRRVGFYVQDFH